MDKKRSSRNLKEKLKDVLQHQFKENLLLLCTIFAVCIGVLIGISLRSLNFNKVTKSYFAFPGELFLRMLKLLILPLISSR